MTRQSAHKTGSPQTHGAWSTEVTEGPTPFETYLTSYLKKEAPAKYLSILTPSYPFGCKRPAHDQGWLRALHRDNVELVGNKITEVVEHGLVTEDGTHRQFDVVIYATGCDVAETGVGLNENVKGEAGLELREHWKSIGGPQAYRSTALPKVRATRFFEAAATLRHTDALLTVPQHVHRPWT